MAIIKKKKKKRYQSALYLVNQILFLDAYFRNTYVYECVRCYTMCVFVCHRKLRDALVFRVLFAFLNLSVQSFKIVYKDSAHWEHTVKNGVCLFFFRGGTAQEERQFTLHSWKYMELKNKHFVGVGSGWLT